jgi:hypothetical protein
VDALVTRTTVLADSALDVVEGNGALYQGTLYFPAVENLIIEKEYNNVELSRKLYGSAKYINFKLMEERTEVLVI